MVTDAVSNEFIKYIHDPQGRLSSVLTEVSASIKQPGRYALCIGGTETSDIEGISAAGANGESRRITPAVDCEALVIGRPLSANMIPVSPKGIVSPVVISRAMVNLLDCKIEVYDCGTFVQPKVESLRVGAGPAKRIDGGEALEYSLAEKLFERGQKVGKELAATSSYIVIGECVPGGTTTAMGVLAALGYDSWSLVSSSMPSSDQESRRKLVEDGLTKSGLGHGGAKQDPLRAVAAVGDPMQPFACGLALAASRDIPVILGGGTQMLTVYALARALAGDAELLERKLAVVTTKWVAFDPAANAAKLAQMEDAPFAASCPSFHCSRHPGLQAYEQGNVKEGVAAGAMMALAHLAGFSEQRICESVDLQYDRMVPKNFLE